MVVDCLRLICKVSLIVRASVRRYLVVIDSVERELAGRDTVVRGSVKRGYPVRFSRGRLNCERLGHETFGSETLSWRDSVVENLIVSDSVMFCKRHSRERPS